MKGLKNCPLFVLITSLCQQVFIPLQKMQASSISSGGTTLSPYNGAFINKIWWGYIILINNR